MSCRRRPVAQSAALRRLTKFVGCGFSIVEVDFMGRETSFRRARSLNVLYMEGSVGVVFGDDMGSYDGGPPLISWFSLNGPTKFSMQSWRYRMEGEEISKTFHLACISWFHLRRDTSETSDIIYILPHRLAKEFVEVLRSDEKTTPPPNAIRSFQVASWRARLQSPWRRCSATPTLPPPSAESGRKFHCIEMGNLSRVHLIFFIRDAASERLVLSLKFK